MSQTQVLQALSSLPDDMIKSIGEEISTIRQKSTNVSPVPELPREPYRIGNHIVTIDPIQKQILELSIHEQRMRDFLEVRSEITAMFKRANLQQPVAIVPYAILDRVFQQCSIHKFEDLDTFGKCEANIFGIHELIMNELFGIIYERNTESGISSQRRTIDFQQGVSAYNLGREDREDTRWRIDDPVLCRHKDETVTIAIETERIARQLALEKAEQRDSMRGRIKDTLNKIIDFKDKSKIWQDTIPKKTKSYPWYKSMSWTMPVEIIFPELPDAEQQYLIAIKTIFPDWNICTAADIDGFDVTIHGKTSMNLYAYARFWEEKWKEVCQQIMELAKEPLVLEKALQLEELRKKGDPIVYARISHTSYKKITYDIACVFFQFGELPNEQEAIRLIKESEPKLFAGIRAN